MGRFIEHYRHKRWFPVSEEKLERTQQAYHRFGRWSLLISWVHIIGDPLTVVAGVLREPFWSLLLILRLAKATRHLVLAPDARVRQVKFFGWSLDKYWIAAVEDLIRQEMVFPQACAFTI